MTNAIHNTIQTKVIRHWNVKTTNQSHLFSQRLHCNCRHCTSLSIIINTNNRHNEFLLHTKITSPPYNIVVHLRDLYLMCWLIYTNINAMMYQTSPSHTSIQTQQCLLSKPIVPRLLSLDRIILLGVETVYWFTCTTAEKCVCRAWNEQIFTTWCTQWATMVIFQAEQCWEIAVIKICKHS